MKKLIVAIALIAGICGLIFAFGERGGESGEREAYLRIHIRADSNGEADQAVKYKVRDKVVEYLTPIVAECKTKEEAMRRIRANLSGVEQAAAGVLLQNGFGYGARADLEREEFPTRVYENVTLGAGVYDALILRLGSGEGDNWWCVVYPPLCFSGGNGNIVYQSKIAEIIRSFFGD